MTLATKSKPLAVLISDVHFALKTKEIAAMALRAALIKATALRVPLIIAGDLHDTKAILRGECISAIIRCLSDATVPVKVLVGNHDKIHEKSDDHALEFLRPYVDLIDSTRFIDEHLGNSVGFIPYQSSTETFLEELKKFRPGHTIVCHQGFKGAFMGEYTKDESSISTDLVSDFTIISGHYHRHQSIGTVTYIGTPYTITFAESSDGPKGYVILNRDNSVDQVYLNLRKHVTLERNIDNILDPVTGINSHDLLWVKVTGTKIELDKLDKKKIGQYLIGHQNFKLDKIPTDIEIQSMDINKLSNEEILDKLIDLDSNVLSNSNYLKSLWRELLK